MRFIPLLVLLASCSQVSVRKPEDTDVSINAAVNHAQMSYLKGCVDAYHTLGVPKAFDECRDKSQVHREEIEEILAREPE